MVDLQAVIRRFGPQAITLLSSSAERDADNKALNAVKSQADPKRIEAICSWLRSYQVFQGIPGPKRTAIAEAFLRWADSQSEQEGLSTVNALCLAHESLMAGCVAAFGKDRDFTSLASKALWLCYPHDVPLFDSRARRTLRVLSKLEDGVMPLADKLPEYRQFVHIWKALYERYGATLDEVPMRGYPHRVRVFDVILWIVGSPGY